MSKIFLKLSMVLAVAAGLAGAVRGAVTVPQKQLSGHVPAVTSRLTAAGRVAGTNVLHLAIGLPLRNADGLDALLGQVYDPASPNYHHFLSAKEFTDQFGPTEADLQAVVNFAKANGLTVRSTSPNRTIVSVSGRSQDIESAFHVKLKTYQHPTENRQFYAPDVEPTVDANLPVFAIAGLNNLHVPKPLLRRTHAGNLATNSLGKPLSTGSSPEQTYWGNDFRNAYCPGVTLTGAGQRVALYECDGYYPSDITAYLTQCGLPAVTLTNVLIDGFNGQPSGTGGEIEVELDIDMANAMAPGLTQIMVYEGAGFDSSVADNVDVLNAIATDNLAKQISSSWLLDDSAQYAQIYKEFALQGQSFFQASGDSGSYYPGIFQFEDSPLVTLVGGTTLTSTAGAGGVWQSEQVWNNGYDPSAGHEWSGGGGISQVYKIPSWQKWINMTTNQGSTTMRNIPDVAFTADNVYIVAYGSPVPDEGGTSAAAPLWAGYMALVNQQMASNHLTPIGFINPTIYSLAQTANYTNLFHDIVVGNNTNDVNTTLYSAVPGYDLASGLGTPNGPNLLAALSAGSGGGGGSTSSAPVVISAPLPPWGSTLGVANGSNPNGAWFLFIQDDTPLNVGMINSGWSLTVNTGTALGTPADVQVSAPNIVSLSIGATTNIALTVTNYGPVASTNVLVTDILPVTCATFLGCTPSNAVTKTGNVLSWNVGTLATNTGASLTLTFTGAAAGLDTNTPAESASTYDPNPDDKTATTYFSVTANPPQLVVSPLTGSGGNQFYLTITNSTGVTVYIQATTNLISPSWVNVYTDTTPFTTNIDVTTNFNARYYRAVTQP